MTEIIEKPIFGLVQGRNPNVFSNEVNGVSNSLVDMKPIWNEDLPLTYVANVNRQISIVSTSNEDKASGAGVKTIRITGLTHSTVGSDNFYKPIFVDVAMNGTTPVNVTGNWYRVTKLESIEFGVGAGYANYGAIKVVIQGTNFVFNCMNNFDNVSNALMITPPSGSSVVLENITINAYMQTFTELEFRIIRTDASVVKFQKVFINTNTPQTTFPINKSLQGGETFYIVMRNLQSIIGHNHISAMLETTNLSDGRIGLINKPFAEYGVFCPDPVPSAPV